MSAFVVSKEHIDALIRAGLDLARTHSGSFVSWRDSKRVLRRLDGGSKDDHGAMLWQENHASVNARYSEDTPVPEYRYDVITPRRSVVESLKLLNCYEYQSCEHDGWKGSDAYLFCDALRGALIRELPGYSEAAWSV